MDFNYESEMTKLVEDWLLGQGMQVKREYPTPWGICDLVGCSFNKLKVKKRLKLGQKQPIGSHFRVLLLSYIPDAEENEFASFEVLHKEFASLLDKPYIEKELQRLKKDKFIEEVEPSCFHKLNGWYPLHKKIVAVELKLDRISEVLSQAQSNLAFADESYVALPYDNAKRLFTSRDRRQLTEKGIGILGIRSSGIRMFLRSRFKSGSNSVLKMHCAERFWRTYPKPKGNST
jgi:hypothetical protein